MIDTFVADVPLIGDDIRPPVTVAVPEVTANDIKFAELAYKIPPSILVISAEPPVRIAVPLVTVRLESVVLEVSVPPYTFDKPLTVPPVRFVLPLDVKLFRVPPEIFNNETDMVSPITVPPVILAVPLVTRRLPIVTSETKRPPVIFVSPVIAPPVRMV